MSQSTMEIERVVREVLAELGAAPPEAARQMPECRECGAVREMPLPPATAVAGRSRPLQRSLHRRPGRLRPRGHDERSPRPAGLRAGGWWFRGRRSSRRRSATNCSAAASPWSMPIQSNCRPAAVRLAIVASGTEFRSGGARGRVGPRGFCVRMCRVGLPDCGHGPTGGGSVQARNAGRAAEPSCGRGLCLANRLPGVRAIAAATRRRWPRRRRPSAPICWWPIRRRGVSSS